VTGAKVLLQDFVVSDSSIKDMYWSKYSKRLVGGFKDFLCSPLFGEDSHFDSHFSDALKPPTTENLWKQQTPAILKVLLQAAMLFAVAEGHINDHEDDERNRRKNTGKCDVFPHGLNRPLF